MDATNTLLNTIRNSVIGENATIQTAFGEKPLVYADYTASGRSLGIIEDFIHDQVLPFYANTHTETSFTGAQTTRLREEARAQIASAINASDDDLIIFCGSGTTAAIDKLINILNLRLPNELDSRYAFDQQISEPERPVVFIGPYEHHSNELPWRESIADVIVTPLTEEGLLDIVTLQQNLRRYADRPLKIGSFSAASNVTGLKTDVEAVTQLLHEHGALAFWDYAASGPYVEIDMHGNSGESRSKDAVFISPHKFIGGPGTPGILAMKKTLLQNQVPAVTGGGTVAYVTPEGHRYISDPQRREEAGTPGIIESIRAGLVFKLQQTVGTDQIQQLEERFTKKALARWGSHPNIQILGNAESPRLSIFSFRITHNDHDLHYNFIVALLNDIFGIQARGGCSCAGPYGHSLLDLDMPTSKAIEAELLNGQMILRPGWTRINFNYFISNETFDYILNAVELVAEFGWRLLPYYQFDTKSGTWRYQGFETQYQVSLDDFDPQESARDKATGNTTTGNIEHRDLEQYLKEGEQILRCKKKGLIRQHLDLNQKVSELRWFTLPQEVA